MRKPVKSSISINTFISHFTVGLCCGISESTGLITERKKKREGDRVDDGGVIKSLEGSCCLEIETDRLLFVKEAAQKAPL